MVCALAPLARYNSRTCTNPRLALLCAEFHLRCGFLLAGPPPLVSRRASRAPTVVARRGRSRSTVKWYELTPSLLHLFRFPSSLGGGPVLRKMNSLACPDCCSGEGAHSPPSRHRLGGSGFRTPTGPGGAKESGETRSRAASPVMHSLVLRSSPTLIPSPRRTPLCRCFSSLLPFPCPARRRLSSVRGLCPAHLTRLFVPCQPARLKSLERGRSALSEDVGHDPIGASTVDERAGWFDTL